MSIFIAGLVSSTSWYFHFKWHLKFDLRVVNSGCGSCILWWHSPPSLWWSLKWLLSEVGKEDSSPQLAATNKSDGTNFYWFHTSPQMRQRTMWCEDTLSKAPKSNLCTRYIDCALVSQKKRQSIRKAMCWTIFLSKHETEDRQIRKFFYPKRAQLSWITGKKWKVEHRSIILTSTAAMAGRTQLRGHIWPVVIRAFVASQPNFAIMRFLWVKLSNTAYELY